MISGERTEQLDIFCHVTWLYEWFSQFCRCGTYSFLSQSPSTDNLIINLGLISHWSQLQTAIPKKSHVQRQTVNHLNTRLTTTANNFYDTNAFKQRLTASWTSLHRLIIQKKTSWQNGTNLSDCCTGLQTSATLEVFLTLREVSSTSCGLFWNSISYTKPNR